MVRMAHASALLRSGDYVAALLQASAGFAAIPRNLEAILWLAGSLLCMFAAVLVMGSMTFIVWAGISVFRSAAHDLGDLVSGDMADFARAALLGSILLVPLLAGEALMGIVLGFFAVAFLYGSASCRRVLVVACGGMLLGLYPIARMAGVALTALDSDPVAVAMHEVAQDRESTVGLETLVAAEADDWLAQYALALRERRVGNRAVALERYGELLETRPRDPVILSTLANLHFELGQNDRSIEFSERAVAQAQSATLLFNLSQAYARAFRMSDFEAAMARAQELDPDHVAMLSGTTEPDFVADLSMGVVPLLARILRGARAGAGAFVDPIARSIMPGWLGRSWIVTTASFGLVAVLALLTAGRWDHSSTCGRCGRRICRRCQRRIWNKDLCEGCHHLFERPDTTDTKLRMARLAQLRRRTARITRWATLASVFVPGVGGFLARRPGLGFLGLILFGWGVVLVIGRNGVVPDPLVIGAAAPLAFSLAAGLAAIAYVLVVTAGLRIRGRA
jgi:tetratricopeptide (TPR) repeat protein